MAVSTQSKIIAAVGVTALVVAVLMIVAFFGYLYLIREGGITGRTSSEPSADSPTPRRKQQSSVAPSDISKVEFSESVYSSAYSANTKAFFGNVNPQNNAHSIETTTFSSDGTATKVKSGERTVNGSKIWSGPTLDSALISSEDFSVLTSSLAENDFINEEDSHNISSLPIKKVLTISYKSGVKVIKTGNMDKDTPEITEILSVFRALEQKMAWKRR